MRRLVSVLALGLVIGLVVGLSVPSSAGPSAALRRLSSRIGALEARAGTIESRLGSIYTKSQVDALIYTEAEANARFLHRTTIVRESDLVTTFDEHTTTCPAGQQALGGGVEFPSAQEATEADVQIAESGPVVGSGVDVSFASGWHVGVYNFGPGSEAYTVIVICAEPETF